MFAVRVGGTSGRHVDEACFSQRLSRDFGMAACVEPHRTSLLRLMMRHNMAIEVPAEEEPAIKVERAKFRRADSWGA